MLVVQIMKEVFKTFYKGLFKSIILNLIGFLFVSPIVFLFVNGIYLEFFIPFMLPIFLIGPIILTGLNLLNNIYRNKDFNLKKVLSVIKNSFLPGLLAISYTLIVYIILLVDIWFFYGRSGGSIIFLALTALFVYLTVFFSITQLYFWGLMVDSFKIKFWTRIKRSFFLAVDNILQSFLWLTIIMAITGIFLYFTPIFPALYFSITGFTIVIGTDKFLNTYNEQDYKTLMNDGKLSE
ncbi:MAG: hypothetical protein ACOCVD_02190 [Bacillota bacterium]